MTKVSFSSDKLEYGTLLVKIFLFFVFFSFVVSIVLICFILFFDNIDI